MYCVVVYKIFQLIQQYYSYWSVGEFITIEVVIFAVSTAQVNITTIIMYNNEVSH